LPLAQLLPWLGLGPLAGLLLMRPLLRARTYAAAPAPALVGAGPHRPHPA
jgi:hypothetical protein